MTLRALPLWPFMAFAIAVVTALAYWDARRESVSALADLAGEQATLARAISAAVSGRVRVLGASAVSRSTTELLSDFGEIERPGSLRLFLVRPDAVGLGTTDGRVVRDGDIEHALGEGRTSVRLNREDALAFSLPRRTALAGIATFAGPSGTWGVVVVATALRERDRAVRAQWRSVAGVLLVSGLIAVFGGLAMRKQRKELELARELEVAALRRDRERQLVEVDKLATMAALATGIAHEVSTPLGVIVGRAEQLRSKVGDDERARKGVESIIEQGTRIGGVIRGFLNLARGGSPPLERVNPAAVVDAACDLLEHRLENAGVRLSRDVPAKCPDVACDPRLLEQVLINLLTNASDACERGGSIELSVTFDLERVSFVVVDDGAGISPEAAARAAEPFFTTKPAGRGTGLGLLIATEIVKHHGGELSIAPREGHRGTRASVELPIMKDAT